MNFDQICLKMKGKEMNSQIGRIRNQSNLPSLFNNRVNAFIGGINQLIDHTTSDYILPRLKSMVKAPEKRAEGSLTPVVQGRQRREVHLRPANNGRSFEQQGDLEHESRGPSKFREIFEFADNKMNGKQRRVVLSVIKADGRKPIEELGNEVEWKNPEDNFNSIRKPINNKLDPNQACV